MQYDSHRYMFDCNSCSDVMKEMRGCEEPGVVKKIDCYCGNDETCSLCKGSGRIKLDRCINYHAKRCRTGYLMRYFYHYRKLDQYPDGGSILDQPVMLLSVFTMLTLIAGKKEKTEDGKNG